MNADEPADEPGPARLPGPPSEAPDLAAVSASIDPPAVAPPAVVTTVAPAAPAISTPAFVPPTSDVAAVPAASRIPGTPAPGYGRLPTAAVATFEQGPSEGDTAVWTPLESPAPRPVAGAWALGLAAVALAASFLVGWMLPLGIAAIVVGIVASRRPLERRGVVVWALVLGGVSVAYSAGWLLWAAWRSGLIG